MKRKHWWFIALGCALAAAALYSGLLDSQRTFARGQPAPALQAADGQICPLSPTQETKSIQAFAEMMPVLTHPRCINCHGAVQPFAADGGHLGGRIPVPMETTTEVDAATGKLIDVDRPAADQFKNCDECHSLLPGWKVPPSDKFFVGKDAPMLCHQMRFFFSSPQLFVEHLEFDRFQGAPQFIEEAFRGTRALDATGQAKYEDETKKDYTLEPPPNTHPQFNALGQQWVDIIKKNADEFKGGETCGCKPHHYALKIGADIGLVFKDPQLTGKFDSHEDLKIPITFKDDGSFSGETTADRNMTGGLVVSTPLGSISCTATYAEKQEVWKVEGSNKATGSWFDVKLSDSWPNPPQITVVCPGAGGVGSALAPAVEAAGIVSFQMPNDLEGSANGDPGPLEVSQPPSVQKYTVHWVDDAAP